MSNFSETLKARGKKLRHVSTRVTLPNGQVLCEDGGQVTVKEQSYGFVIDTKPDLQVGDVGNGLFISSQDVANDETLLENYKITHVLNVSGSPSVKFAGIFYCDIMLLDLPEQSLNEHFLPCFQFIENALKTGRVLVHCNAGVSRSVSVVIAFLMKSRHLRFDEAFNVVKTARPSSKPNEGFTKQLIMYEKILTDDSHNHLP